MTVQRTEAGSHSLAVNQNTNAASRKEAGRNQKNSGQIKNGSINMNQLGGKMDSILMRKQRAQKKAMKIVSDAWTADKKFDADLQERRSHVQELKNSLVENKERLENCNAAMAEIKEIYGIEEGSQEQRDVELVQLWNKNSTANNMSKGLSAVNETLSQKEIWEDLTGISLTDDDWQRMTELQGKISSPTDYQKRALEIADEVDFFQKNIDDTQIDLMSEDIAIRTVKIERLKEHGMVDAQKEADEINEAASKEFIGALIGEAQDYIDEKMEEKKEEAKEKAEEKEKQEEKIEEQRAEKELQQAQLDLKREESHIAEETKSEQRKKAREQAELIEEAGSGESLSGLSSSDAKIAIKEMLQKMKLLEEDLKGAALDAKIDK
ncbi:MAG: hypothetical protein NC231_13380 [Bacillus sp. (in: Bacteria)]|nr:hypothetical protein [Bacillus sp. (in: firmicutes)]MCM1425019.1 hypothetical protein [Eubacterium sp.]